MGEAEATAAKSTSASASDAAREPTTVEEGTAPTTASGVCGRKDIQSYDSVHDEIHSCISFIFIGDFPGF